MCGSPVENHRILGQRLNTSQGFRPKKKTGIGVSIVKCTTCGLIYSQPQPIPTDIQDHYGTPPENYWKPEYFTWKPGYFATEINEAKEILGSREHLSALDIGAGLGKAMLSLQHYGFDTMVLSPLFPFTSGPFQRWV
jgi:hypothetical protein